MTSIEQMKGASMPNAFEKQAKYLVMFLHGVGADGHDLIGLAPQFSSILPDAYFDSPHAPYSCDMAPVGRQWFSLQSRAQADLQAGMDACDPLLNGYIDHMLETLNMTIDQLIIIGFSQGTMMGLYTMLQRDKPCAAIVGFSGAYIPPSGGIISKPPVCLIHGEQDEVVDFGALAAAQQELSANGLTVEAHPQPELGHSINIEGVEAAKQFLINTLKL